MLADVVKFTLGTGISVGLHLYLWKRIVKRLDLPRPWHRAATGFFFAMVLLVATAFRIRLALPHVAQVLGWIVLPWYAFVGLAVVTAVGFDMARLLAWGITGVRSRVRTRVPAPPAAAQLDRRQFLARVTGGATFAVASTSVAVGMVSARGDHEITNIEVTLAKLPRALDGFTIVQLSDLHVGLTIDRAFVQRVVDRANALNPDLIALTGDLVDGKVPDLRDDFSPLAGLVARHGVVSVTGNHEYYSGADAWIAEQRRLGFRVLRNEHITIGEGGESFDLAGVDDHGAFGPGHGENLPAAVAGRDSTRALVLLAHQPRQVRRAVAHGVDLQLSGHTHGGQIWPWHYLVKLQQGGLLAGMYQVGTTQLYVTRGCGYWGPPVRLLAPLEITRVILRAPRTSTIT